MRKYIENGKTIVAYSREEVAFLPRLEGTGRPMTDEEITAAALSDIDAPILPLIPKTQKRGREFLREYLAPDMLDKLLSTRACPFMQHPKHEEQMMRACP